MGRPRRPALAHQRTTVSDRCLHLNAPGGGQPVPKASAGQQLTKRAPEDTDAIEQGKDDQRPAG
eukprot:12924431-Alexandrium_andersonii.AAC.1